MRCSVISLSFDGAWSRGIVTVWKEMGFMQWIEYLDGILKKREFIYTKVHWREVREMKRPKVRD